jgi:predicted enzyme related to lactoylglutathione lyase
MTSTGHHHAPAVRHLHPNAPRARRFYQEMFGWPVNVLDQTYALVGDDGGRRVGPGIVGYFQVDNVDTALARVEQLGGSRTLDPQSVPGRGWIAVTDPATPSAC